MHAPAAARGRRRAARNAVHGRQERSVSTACCLRRSSWPSLLRAGRCRPSASALARTRRRPSSTQQWCGRVLLSSQSARLVRSSQCITGAQRVHPAARGPEDGGRCGSWAHAQQVQAHRAGVQPVRLQARAALVLAPCWPRRTHTLTQAAADRGVSQALWRQRRLPAPARRAVGQHARAGGWLKQGVRDCTAS